MIEDLKAANTRREAESRIIADQMKALKDQVPKALEGWKANGDAKLEELSQEMQSLKKLLENRVGRSGGTTTPVGRGYPSPATNTSDQNKDANLNQPSNNHGITASTSETSSTSASAPGVTAPKHESSIPTSPKPDRKAIPAWQRAAAGEKNGAASSSGGNSENSKPG